MTLHRVITAWAIVGPLAGCTIAMEDFPTKYSVKWCKKWNKCDAEELEEVWETVDDCVDGTEDLTQAFVEFSVDTLGGSYDEIAARRCLSDLGKASCDELAEFDFSDACDDVVD